MDWTDFEADGQATIMLSLLTRHGRATPLVWLTVDTATLKNRRNGYEYQVLVRLAEVLPANAFERIHSSLQTIFGADLHAKRVASLAGATMGVIESASFQKPRTGLPILFLCASLNRNEGRNEGPPGIPA